MATFFFCGIGGIGMSAIALYLKKSGHEVLGSDRAFDMGKNEDMRQTLLKNGIELFSQDGTGLNKKTDVLVVSSAVEETIPDVKQALALHIPIKKRAEVLAEIFKGFSKRIAIAGTSGKTTVTAMTGHILYHLNQHPVMINGGISRNMYGDEGLSNLIYNKGDVCVIEADESDGSIELYTPTVSVVTNISLDHKPLAEIKPLFERFLSRAETGCVINKNCTETKNINVPVNAVSFSVEKDKTATLFASDVRQTAEGLYFKLNEKECHLPFIGRHNLENALTALAVCQVLGLDIALALEALSTFKGTKRRLEKIGTQKGITVIDDYAHNEEKIKASLSALKTLSSRLFVVYQPHGFAPLRLMKDGLIQMLKSELDENIFYLMLPVYYVGGTVAKTISSADVVEPLKECGKNALLFEEREDVLSFIKSNVKAGDVIAVMGARDDTLSLFAKNILDAIGEN